MLAAKSESAYESLFRNSMSLPISIIEKEQQEFGSDHAVIGVLIAKKWCLPIDMLSAIMLHHKAECSLIKKDRVRAMVAMIKIANAMVAEISLGAYRGEEMRLYEKDGVEELMIPTSTINEIRTALMSYTFKS